jgi:hypothetical protein
VERLERLKRLKVTAGDERRRAMSGGSERPVRDAAGAYERRFAHRFAHRFVRRLGLAWTGLLAAVLVSPIAIACFGAFSTSEWYGQRSEGARVAGTGALFRYVFDVW